MTTDGNGYAKSAALVAGTYYVKEITAPKGYVLSGKVHTLTVKAGQTTGISATDKEQLGAITIYKEGEVLSSWNGSNFTYEKKKLSGATFKVTAGADIYKADGTKVYADFGRNPHGVQGGIRPGIVVSCDASNHGGAPQISVVPLSSKLKDNPVHVIVDPSEIRGYALSNRSDFMPEDIQTLNKGCVRFKSGYIPGESEIREAMDRAIPLRETPVIAVG